MMTNKEIHPFEEYDNAGNVFENFNHSAHNYGLQSNSNRLNSKYLLKMKEQLKETLKKLIEEKEAEKEEQDRIIHNYDTQINKIKVMHTNI